MHPCHYCWQVWNETYFLSDFLTRLTHFLWFLFLHFSIVQYHFYNLLESLLIFIFEPTAVLMNFFISFIFLTNFAASFFIIYQQYCYLYYSWDLKSFVNYFYSRLAECISISSLTFKLLILIIVNIIYIYRKIQSTMPIYDSIPHFYH